MLALAHGVDAGPDGGSAWVRGLYVVAAAVLAAAVGHRIAASWGARRSRAYGTQP